MGKPMSRQTLYTVELADAICERLVNGESLRQICQDEGMPNRSTVIRWMGADEAFATKCARARDEQADYMDDLILETANSCTPESAAADRVKISAYQWRASKLKPKKYGDRTRTELTGAGGGPLIPAEQGDLAAARRIAYLLDAGLRAAQSELPDDSGYEPTA
jgi:hypothetical protein